MNVLDVRCIHDPGCHCAFTDILSWNGRIYVVFREAVNHGVHFSGQIVVLGSADYGASFQVHARLAHRGYDLRDPHLFIVQDRLCLAIPSWVVPEPDRGIPERIRCTHIAQSEDGIDWDLQLVLDPLQGRTLWRPRRGPDGRWYAASYAPARGNDDYRVALYRSKDGWSWKHVSLIHGKDKANETELCFLPDGELLALVRREAGPCRPLLAASRPPYHTWTKLECSRFLQGPLLERLPDGSLLVVGRSREPLEPEEPGGQCRTRGFRLDRETGKLEDLFTLPSGGDTSYAGLQELQDGTFLLSYYSGHEHEDGSYRDGESPQRCGIYLARLESAAT